MKMQLIRKLKGAGSAVGAVMLGLTLGGCGGGGDNDGGSSVANSSTSPITAPSAPVTLTGGIADQVVGVIMRDEIGVDADDSSAPPSQSYGMTRARWVSSRLGNLMSVREDAYLQSKATGAALDETIACSAGGTVTYTSPVGAASFTANHSNCGVEASSRAMGTVKHTGFKSSYIVGTSTQRTINGNLSVTDAQRTVRMEGLLDYTVICQNTTCDMFDLQAVSGRDAYSDGANSIVSTFSLAAGNALVTTLASSELNGSVSYDDSDPQAGFGYVGADPFPVSGYQIYRGANGSKIRLTVLAASSAPGPHVQTEVDANGDGKYEITVAQAWSGVLN
jgi:hypothetical protein